MSGVKPIASLLVIAAAVSCSPRDTLTSPLQRYGWRESFRYRAITEESITIANAVLKAMSNVTFRPAWQDHSEGVPVYLVDGERLSADYIVFVPGDRSGVIVNTDELPAMLAMFTPESPLAAQISKAEVLAFCLLHEAGHLHFRDAGSRLPDAALSGRDVGAIVVARDSVPSREAIQRNAELRADLFAIDAIRAAQEHSLDSVHSAGVDMELALSDLKWNLGLRRDPEGAGFGVSGGNDRRVFRDTTYTHPNLEFRLRVVNVVASSSNGSVLVDYALDAFLRERTDSPGDEPYWASSDKSRAPVSSQ